MYYYNWSVWKTLYFNWRMNRLVFRTFFRARKTFRRKCNESFDWSTISSWFWIAKQDIELYGHRIWSHDTKSSYLCASFKISNIWTGHQARRGSQFSFQSFDCSRWKRECIKGSWRHYEAQNTWENWECRKKIQNLDTKWDKSLLSERRKYELEGEACGPQITCS